MCYYCQINYSIYYVITSKCQTNSNRVFCDTFSCLIVTHLEMLLIFLYDFFLQDMCTQTEEEEEDGSSTKQVTQLLVTRYR